MSYSKDISYEGNTKLKIQEFDLKNMVPDPAIVIVAKRGSGKTWVCRALIEHYKTIPVGIIISETEHVDPFFKNFFPDSFIYQYYRPEIFDKILRRQTRMKRKLEQKQAEGKSFDPRLLLIMDDCLASSKTWSHDESIKEILYNGRHYHITYILTMQFPLGISPDLRSQFDYVYLLYEDNINNLKRLYEHYAGIFPTLQSFREVFSQLTDDYGTMVLVKRGNDREFNKKVFFYKAHNIVPTVFGCSEMQEYHRKNYNKEWLDHTRKLDIAEYCDKKKKDKSSIKIEKVDKFGSSYKEDGYVKKV